VEEQFYLVWPWIIIYSPKKHLLKIILTAIGIGIISNLVLDYRYGEWAHVLLLPCITAFAIGALWAYVQMYRRFEKTLITAALLLLPVCIILLYINHNGDNRLILIRFVNSVIAVNAIIYASREKYNRVSGYIFNNKLLVNIGKISYGVYLYHFILPVYYNAFINYLRPKIGLSDHMLKILTMPPSAYLIRLGFLFILSILSYRYIELVFLRLKRNFSYVPVKKEYSPEVNGL
jgi:peptidoglycan/LPS O-acetylase OafA/YrhL